MDPPFLCEIRFFSFGFAPNGWALCNGQLLPINQNQAAFSLLGTTYGGDGRVNFALPDLRGRVPFGQGNGHVLGEIGGVETVQLSQAQIPTHTHDLHAATAPGGTALAAPLGVAAFSAYAKTGTVSQLGGVRAVGNNTPHTNMQPYTVGSFCIALEGSFPSRS